MALGLQLLVACAGSKQGPSVATIPVQELDGRGGTLGVLAGEPALVYLMTTSCDVCLADIGKLRALHAEYATRGLRVVVVALDPGGAMMPRHYAESLALPFPLVVAGAALRDGDTALGPTPAVPRILVVGRDARVRADLAGAVPYAVLARHIEAALDHGAR